jgi:hypothetical protein
MRLSLVAMGLAFIGGVVAGVIKPSQSVQAVRPQVSSNVPQSSPPIVEGNIEPSSLVVVSFESDPTGVPLRVNGQDVGLTPQRVALKVGESVHYALSPDPNFFHPYANEFIAQKNDALLVWLDRLTPEEIDAVRYVNLAFTSDPAGASLYVDEVYEGVTPITVKVPKNEPLTYRLVAGDSYADYDLYKPFTASLLPTKDDAISVWIERTSLEEQNAQIARAEAARPESPTPSYVIEPIRACCKYCSKGKPCGDTCISRNKTCHVGPGCAC